jgi:serine/threonine protein phosphatase 1
MRNDKGDTAGRILAIGDIHGCSLALEALLEAVDPGPDDLIITLGDYIDRGPDSKKVVQQLIALHETQSIVSLTGNHEELVLDWRQNGYDKTLLWWANGGLATLRSYTGGETKWLLDMFWRSFLKDGASDYHAQACGLIPPAHWDFFENCLDWYETDNYIFIHGGLDPDLDLPEQSPHNLRWARFRRSQQAHRSGKKVICGHTPQADGKPADIGHTVCIDTYLYGGQWLTCMDVRNTRYYQANYLGETRILA